MAASAAQIQANRMNSARSTGPKSIEGKEKSRANALKHGLTGAGVVLPEADAAEVKRRAAAFVEELEAVGELQTTLARRAALNSVRMERGADQQTAALTDRVRQVEADFVPPEGVSEAEAGKLRDETVRRAMFDPSREATLARKYEAAAERGFHRAIKELRQLQKQSQRLDPGGQNEIFRQELASYLSASAMDDEFDAMDAEAVAKDPSLAAAHPVGLTPKAPSPRFEPSGGSFEVPFAIGKAR